MSFADEIKTKYFNEIELKENHKKLFEQQIELLKEYIDSKAKIGQKKYTIHFQDPRNDMNTNDKYTIFMDYFRIDICRWLDENGFEIDSWAYHINASIKD